jgi:sec-independent protein translocase protein TatA
MGIGPMHLFVLAAIALLFFGPSKLPGLGKSMGEAIKGFKDAMNDVNGEADQISRSVQAPLATSKPEALPKSENIVDVTESARETANVSADPKPKTPVT